MRKEWTTLTICEADKCTGCGACMNICPTGCVSMEPNRYGILHPVVNGIKCIECKKCIRICPSNNEATLLPAQKVYASWRKDEQQLKDSASGGIGAVAEHWIANGGIVYGTAYDENFHPRIEAATTLDGIQKFKGSKYVQSETGFVYNEVREFLKQGKKVLFFGTPCQLAGLYSIVGRSFDNLLTVEILCHGVSPDRYFQEEIEQLRKENGIDDFDNVSFRTNRWLLDFSFAIWNKGQLIYEKPAYENRYFASFLTGLSLRESCYQCKYKSVKRLGDLLIGDFIGLGKNVPFEFSSAHKSLVICMSENGSNFLNRCSEDLMLVERTIEEAIFEGRSLRESFPRHPKQREFQNIVVNKGFISAAEEILGESMKLESQKNRKWRVKRNLKIWLYYKFHIKIHNKRISIEK